MVDPRHDAANRRRANGWAGDDASNGSVFRDLGRLARALGALLRDHAVLARVEAREEGKRVAIDASAGVAALPFAFTALIMLSVALAVGLSGWIGVGWAFFAVGLLDLAIAGVLATFAALRLRKEPARTLALTREELARDREMARRVVERLRAPTPRAAIPPHDRPPRSFPGGGVHPSDHR
ncbi:MAG TPA: phage holin family protein [Fredinandcohnia sp.]|nr:phage holin family protein [Fredinandcohnia sp.]